MSTSAPRMILIKSAIYGLIFFLPFISQAQICSKYEISPDTVLINNTTVFSVQEKTGNNLPPELWVCNWIDFENNSTHECTNTTTCQFTFTTPGLHAVSYEINEPFLGNTEICTSYVYVVDCSPGTLLAEANGTSGTLTACVGSAVALYLNTVNALSCSGDWEYSWFDGSHYFNGTDFTSEVEIWDITFQNATISGISDSTTFTAKVRCSASYTCIDSSKVNVITKPRMFTLSGGGVYCVGSTGLSITLSGSETDVSYQLLKSGNTEGLVVTGTGNSLTWNNLTVGTYTVLASYDIITDCNIVMTGSIDITESPLPVAYNLTGGGIYCAGDNGLNDTLSGSEVGVNYQLKKDGTDEGAVVNGTGDALVWSNLNAGAYTVVATYATSPYCAVLMNNTVIITENPVPVAYNLFGGGSYCAGGTGLNDTLSSSELGVNYQLKKDGIDEGAVVNGTGNALVWTNLTAGTYTVVATNATSPFCAAIMNNTVDIVEGPAITVNQITNIEVCPGTTINTGSFVSVPSGATFSWINSNTNIGIAASGTGNIASWNAPANSTGANIAGTITVTPSLNGCAETPMNFTVTIYPENTILITSVVGTDNQSVCINSPITDITYATTGATGATFSSLPDDVAGTWASDIVSISGIPTVSDTFNYTVVLTGGCGDITKTGTIEIKTTPPQPGLITGIQNQCSDMTNQIYSIDSVSYATTYTWTLPFGWIITAGQGTKSITVTTGSGGQNGNISVIAGNVCGASQAQTLQVTVTPSSVGGIVSGSSSICLGSSTGLLTLNGAIGTVLSWEKRHDGGIWTNINNLSASYSEIPVLAGVWEYRVYIQSSPCNAVYSIAATVTVYPTPTVFNLTGGGTYCAGGSGLSDTLSGSQIGVNYQLKKTGIDEGAVVNGTGNVLVWSNLTAGAYTVVATYATSPFCAALMNNTVDITESPVPVAYNLTGGGSYCAGGNGLNDTLSGSEPGVNYQLKKDDVIHGAAVAGTGNPIVWSNLTAGTYIVEAAYATAPYCAADMNGSVVITVNDLPVAGAGTDQTIPYGTTTALSATASGGSGSYSFSWEPSLLVVDPNSQTTNTYNINSFTQFIVTVQDVNSTCVNTDTILVHITGGPLTVTAIAQANNICSEDTVFLNTLVSGGTGNYTYMWTADPAGFSADSANPYAIPLVNTIYTVSVDDGFNTETSSIGITVHPLPQQFNFHGGGSYCAGSNGLNDTLSGSELGVNYQLKKDGIDEGAVVNGTGNALVWSNLTAGAYTVVATYATSPFCAAVMNNTVDIVEGPAITVNQITNIAVCPGSTINIDNFASAPTGAAFEWTNSNTDIGLAANGNGNISSWTAPANSTGANIVGTITVTPTLNGCTGTPMSFTVTIYPTPVMSQISNIAVCAGSTINIGSFVSNPTGATFTWTNSNIMIGITASGTGNIVPWVAPPNCSGVSYFGTITVIPTLNGCTGTPMSFTVTVYCPAAVNQINNIAVCPGTPINIGSFVSSPTGATFAWTNSNTNIGLAASGIGNIPSWTAPANNTSSNIVGTITVTPTLNGCVGTPMSFTVTVYASPTVNQMTNIAVCPATPINISNFVSTPPGATFTWTNSNVNIGLPASGTGNIPTWNAPANNTCTNIVSIITVSPTLNGCQGPPMSFTVTIYPTPTISQKPDIVVCPGSTINIGGFTTCPIGASFSWTNSNIAIGLPSSGGGLAPWTAPANNTGANITGIITVTPSLNGCIGLPMSFTVTISPAPTVFNFTGGGAYCTGGNGLNDTLSGSQVGVNYQLKKDGADEGTIVPGTGSALVWNNLTAGTYMVVATYSSAPYCTADMNGSVIITENALPVAGAGSDQTIPFGTTTTLSATASGSSGSYNFSWEPSSLAVDPGSQSTSTNAINADTYFIVMVQDANTLCVNYDTMFIDVIMPLTVNAVTQANDICENDTVFLNALASGGTENYTYIWASNPPGLNADSANPFVVPLLNTTYTVTVSDGVNTVTSSTSVSIFPLPEQFILNGGGNYCQGASGISIFLDNSYSDVYYQLFQNGQPYGTPLQGIEEALIWDNIPGGSYTVTGTFDYAPSCAIQMSGTVSVTESPSPVVFDVTGSGVYCQGGNGLSVILSSSETGIDYQLFKNGFPSGVPMSGTGNAIEWQNQLNGNYTVTATYTSSPYCFADMNGTVVITQTSSLIAYNLSGGGSYCVGGSGLSVTLSSSQSGINYQLKNNGANQGAVVIGTGNILVWNNLTAGTYTVTASAPPNCVVDMNGSVVISESPLPTVFNLTGGDIYCSGGSDTLSSSEVGVNYQLKKNGAYTGTTISGTGSAMVWNNLSSGTYTVVAAYDAFPYCMADMNGSVVITESSLPTVFDFTGGGAYCAGSTGLNDTLSGSETGVNYQLEKNGVAEGAVVAGTGNALVWSNLTAGTYTVVAAYATAPYCSANMNGSVDIVETAAPVINQKANIFACPGSSINIGNFVSNPVGASFTWTNSNVNIGLAANGSGDILTWIAPSNLSTCINIVGTITVTPSLNGCPGTPMTFTVTIYPTPTVTPISNIAVCPGSTINVGNFGVCPLGSTFTWTNSNTNIGLPVSGSGNIPSWTAPVNNTGANIVGTITITASYNGCFGAPMSFTVTIYPTPSAPLASDISSCWSSPTPDLTATGTGIMSWYSDCNLTSLIWTGSSFATGQAVIGTYTYCVTQTINNCQSSPTPVTLTILGTPSVFTLSGGGSYCAGGIGLSVSLSGSQTGVNYQLKKNGIDEGSVVSGTGNALGWNNLTAGAYTVEANVASNCSVIMNNTVDIIENPLPVVDLGVDTSLCPGQNITLTAPTGTGYTFTWVRLPDDTLNHNQTLYLDTLISGMGTFTYVLIVNDGNNCSGADTINVGFDVCPSVAESNGFSIAVFPNPAQDNLTLEYQKLIPGVYTVELVNMLSQVVLSENINVKDVSGTYSFDVNGLSKGVYNLSFSNHKTVIYNLKVVVY